MTNDHLHHLPAIAQHLNVTPRVVRQWRDRYGLPVHKMGGTVYASRVEIDQWLAAQRARANASAVAAE